MLTVLQNDQVYTINSILKSIASLTIVIILSSCARSPAKQELQIDPLVTTQWLEAHLNDPNLVILDTSVDIKINKDGSFEQVSGRNNYFNGHIPKSGFADLLHDLSADNDSKPFSMPSPEKFQAAIGALGISNKSHVILYSQQRLVWPARLWWMLRWAGHDNVSILDGGFKAWKAEGRAISTQHQQPKAKKFELNLQNKTIAEQKEVFEAISDRNIIIIDALNESHFNGEFSLYQRPGHIPTAINVPSSSLVEETGHFRSIEDIDMLFDTQKNMRTIIYCGGGVAASANAFSLVRLGYTDVAVYMGSLQEWSDEPNNPMTIETAYEP